jgi:hypothetical protein
VKRAFIAVLAVLGVAICLQPHAAEAKSKTIDELTAEKFEGKYRKTPKTSIARKGRKILSVKQYKDLRSLLASLPADAAFRTKYPGLRRGVKKWPDTREPEEMVNVRIKSCWIVSAKHEGSSGGDHDFHVVISNSPTNFKEVMNVEVSALPKPANADSAKLREIRGLFLGLADKPPPAGFAKMKPPKHVLLEGSLYFDGDHGAGGAKDPGPKWAKPKTAWEIHPVTRIKVLPIDRTYR